jgi:hypothetical protein
VDKIINIYIDINDNINQSVEIDYSLKESVDIVDNINKFIDVQIS